MLTVNNKNNGTTSMTEVTSGVSIVHFEQVNDDWLNVKSTLFAEKQKKLKAFNRIFSFTNIEKGNK